MSSSTEKTSYSIEFKASRVDAYNKLIPAPVDEPKTDPTIQSAHQATTKLENAQKHLDDLKMRLQSGRDERVNLVERNASLTRLVGHIQKMTAAYEAFVSENGDEFQKASYDVREIIKLTVSNSPIKEAIAGANKRLEELSFNLNGSSAVRT